MPYAKRRKPSTEFHPDSDGSTDVNIKGFAHGSCLHSNKQAGDLGPFEGGEKEKAERPPSAASDVNKRSFLQAGL